MQLTWSRSWLITKNIYKKTSYMMWARTLLVTKILWEVLGGRQLRRKIKVPDHVKSFEQIMQRYKSTYAVEWYSELCTYFYTYIYIFIWSRFRQRVYKNDLRHEWIHNRNNTNMYVVYSHEIYSIRDALRSTNQLS